jgi:hypothetical protein
LTSFSATGDVRPGLATTQYHAATAARQGFAGGSEGSYTAVAKIRRKMPSGRHLADAALRVHASWSESVIRSFRTLAGVRASNDQIGKRQHVPA